MTLTLPTYRNSFHPGWLLLVAIPVVGLSLGTWHFDGMSLAAFLAQTVLAAIIVGPMVLWRSEDAPPGARRWMKEMRVFLMPLLVSVGIPEVLGVLRILSPAVDFEMETGSWMTTACFLGALMAGATTFGEEFEHRTFGALLSQPRSRWSLFVGKLAPLALVLVWSGANLGLAFAGFGNFARGGELLQILTGCGLLTFVFCTTPLWTLVTRSTLAGAIFTAAVPMGFFMLGRLVAVILSKITGGEITETEVARWLMYAIPVYLVGAAWLGWRVFRTLEVRDGMAGSGAASSVSHPMSRPVDRFLAGVLPSGPWGQLLRKEARLHVVPWLVAGMMVGSWGVYLLIQWIGTRDPDSARTLDPGVMGILFFIMGLLTLLVSGAACVAEERSLGTLEWQLTQPASVTRQWWVKVLTAWGHFLALGLLLPFALFVTLAGWQALGADWTANTLLPAAGLVGAVLLAFSIAVYASSFSRSTMKAAASTIFIAALLLLVPVPFVTLTGVRMDRLALEMEAGPVAAPAWEPSGNQLFVVAVFLGVVFAALLIALLMIFGRRNFSRSAVSRRSLGRQGLALVLLLFVGAGVSTETVLQLTRLEFLGNSFRMHEARTARTRAALRSLLEWQWERKAVSPEFIREFRVGNSPSRTDILNAADSIQDPEVVERWVRSLAGDVFRAAGVTSQPGNDSDVNSLIDYGLPLDRVIEKRMREEAARTNAMASSPSNPVWYRMNPTLARRYGLLPKGESPPSPSDPKVTNQSPAPMDPVMARRYGLTPAAPKTEKAAPPP